MIKMYSITKCCDDCPEKKMLTPHRCPFQTKLMCPKYQAGVAKYAAEFQESAELIPVESLLKALRYHGYTGELRKSVTIKI